MNGERSARTGARRIAVIGHLFNLFGAEADSAVRQPLAQAVVLVLVASGLTASAPWLLKRIVDGLAAGEGVGRSHVPALLFGYVLSQFLARCCTELHWPCYGAAEQRLQRRIGLKLFEHLMRLPLRYHHDRGTGAICQTLANGLLGCRMLLQHVVFTILPAIVAMATVAGVLLQFGSADFLAILAAAVIAYACTFGLGVFSMAGPSRAVSSALVDIGETLADGLQSYEAIKCFNAEEFMQERFDRYLAQAESRWRALHRRKALGGLAAATVFAAALGASCALTAEQIGRGVMTIGDFVLVNAYVLQLVRPLETIGFALRDLVQAFAFLARMIDLLEEAPEPDSQKDRSLSTSRTQGLVFDRVSYSHRVGQPVLRDLEFSLAAGRTLAIVGTSGSGKSTLIRLLLRLYEPDAGTIRLDGVPISRMPLPALRDAIAIVPQDTVLLRDRIATNIALGRAGASQHDIEVAARLAEIHETIMSWPEAYQTMVGERGLTLSGGERQRVAIARAALKRPRLFLFDEATSSLDTETERRILRSLRTLCRGTTTLVIAHRLSTIIDADEILLLERGEIVERGPHADLVRRDGCYAAMWRAQQGGSTQPADTTSGAA
jgi:ABC-type transport system involved in Fe-S cluster assembly fused permease/ATPase subunit